MSVYSKKRDIAFGEKLKQVMREKGLSQQQLAGWLRISQGAVSNYCMGRVPRSDVLKKLTTFLGVEVSELIGDPYYSAKVEFRATVHEASLEDRVKNIELVIGDLVARLNQITHDR